MTFGVLHKYHGICLSTIKSLLFVYNWDYVRHEKLNLVLWSINKHFCQDKLIKIINYLIEGPFWNVKIFKNRDCFKADDMQ